MKVCLHLADGFEEIEAISVVDILRRANIKVEMVSIMGRKEVGAPSDYSNGRRFVWIRWIIHRLI